MNYFSNQELADTYHVSVRTVRNWIESARAGKIDLTLHTKGAHDYVAVSAKNISTIEKLVLEGKKFRPHRAFKTLTPKPEFYELYSAEQIRDIIYNIEIYHEIPPDYNYFEHGAQDWDVYTQRMAAEDDLNTLNATIKLLQINRDYIDNLIKNYDKVNVVDVGVGNAYPIRGFLSHLLQHDKLNRYIAIDTSSSMISIAEQNISKWFEGRVHFEGLVSNFNFQRFRSLISEDHQHKDDKKIANIVVCFGGTLGNLRSPQAALRIIHDSMGLNDIFIYTKKLDTAITRKLFDVDAGSGMPTMVSIFGFVVNLLNIDKSLYEVELGYDPEKQERFERIRMKMAVTLKFTIDGNERLLNLNKDDSLLIWRSKQQSAIDVHNQFESSDFYTLHSSQTDNQEFLMTISRIKRA